LSTRHTTGQILEAYAHHPLSLDSIRGRLLGATGRGLTVSELDLAVDAVHGITDQNHIGGALSTLHLALRARVTAADRVLDLGCGIGGPARLLAEVFGCAVRGLDINARRVDEARQLAELVGLDQRVEFECADLLHAKADRVYSVVWAQNAWIHIDQPAQLAAVAASALVPEGRLAFEDVCLRRGPCDSAERQWMDTLCDSWRSGFSTVEDWCDGFERAGFKIQLQEELDATLRSALERSSALAAIYPLQYPAIEVDGWTAARGLSGNGVIGYSRVIGVLD
jgi:SAM-dependent methyltransferase